MSDLRRACVHCGAAVDPLRLFCGACGRLHRIAPSPLASEDTARPCLTAKDHALLDDYLERHGKRDEFLARLIRAKQAWATVVLSEAIDPAIATLNSRILFRVAGRGVESRTLVHWDREPDVGIGLPITTPLGIALLGARAGDRLMVANRDGSETAVAMVSIAYQPEAARKARSAARSIEREPVKRGAPDVSGPVAAPEFASGKVYPLQTAGSRGRVRARPGAPSFPGDDPGPSAA